jgi:hypothetical protein
LERVVVGRRFLTALTASANDLLCKLASRTSDLNPELIEAVGRFKNSFPEPDDVDRLLSFTSSVDKGVRRDAAEAIVDLGGVLLQQSTLGEAVARCLFDALGNNVDPEVRLAVLPGIAWFAGGNDSNCETAFELALRGLRDADDRLAIGSLTVLRKFGLDWMSSALDVIARALSHESAEVRQLACEVLADLGADAEPAIDSLLACAANDKKRPVRAAAATAIMKVVRALDRIDPGHDHLDIGPADAKLRRSLLTSLREAGPIGRKFRQGLQLRWSRDAPRKSLQAVVPELEEIWSRFTETEQLVLLAIWRERRWFDGTPAQEVIEQVGWQASKDPLKLLRSHLTQIRQTLRRNGVALQLKMNDSSIAWR